MDYRKKFILIYQHHYFVNYTQIDMQKLNYNYRSDVTYIATLDLLLAFIKIFEYYFCYVHVYDQEYVLSQQKDNNLILMFTLKRFRNVFIQRLKIHMFVCKHFFFILPQLSTCIFTKKALTV